jgi:3-dehydrosphinganine reductase
MTQENGFFAGRLALITGGSSGMGLALARLLALEGASIWILGRRKEALESGLKSLASAGGQRHGMLEADVTKWEQVQAAARRIKEQAGVPDLLISAAGAARPGYVQELPLEVFHQMMDLNYFGIVNTVMTFLPDMLKRGSGHIVNFSSGAGFLALFGYAAYVPSKFAVRGLSDTLRLELKPLGLRVSVVFPPDTDTPGLQNENKTKPFETLEGFSSSVLPAESVARAVLHGIKRGQYIILPGAEVSLAYRLTLLLGNAIYPIIDAVLAQARRKKARVQRG